MQQLQLQKTKNNKKKPKKVLDANMIFKLPVSFSFFVQRFFLCWRKQFCYILSESVSVFPEELRDAGQRTRVKRADMRIP